LRGAGTFAGGDYGRRRFQQHTDTSEGQSHDYSIDSSKPRGKFSDSGTAKGLKAGGSSLASYGKDVSANADALASANPGVRSFRKGGRVRKTGLIHAHKNEEVVRPEQADKVRRFLKKTKGRSSDEEMDDPKRTQRKGDPERQAKKEEPAAP